MIFQRVVCVIPEPCRGDRKHTMIKRDKSNYCLKMLYFVLLYRSQKQVLRVGLLITVWKMENLEVNRTRRVKTKVCSYI